MKLLDSLLVFHASIVVACYRIITLRLPTSAAGSTERQVPASTTRTQRSTSSTIRSSAASVRTSITGRLRQPQQYRATINNELRSKLNAIVPVVGFYPCCQCAVSTLTSLSVTDQLLVPSHRRSTIGPRAFPIQRRI